MSLFYLTILLGYILIDNGYSDIIEAYHIGENLDKNVSSDDVLKRYDNGHCIYPGICDLDINQCNIPRISLSQLTYQQFIDNYVMKQQPVIIEICQDYSHCDLSSIINNSSQIWEWNKIINTVRPKDYHNIYSPLEYNYGTPKDRAETCDIHALDDRNQTVYKSIIDSIIQIPAIFEQLDFFNDLVGYLKYSDGPLLGIVVSVIF